MSADDIVVNEELMADPTVKVTIEAPMSVVESLLTKMKEVVHGDPNPILACVDFAQRAAYHYNRRSMSTEEIAAEIGIARRTVDRLFRYSFMGLSFPTRERVRKWVEAQDKAENDDRP